MSDSETDDEDLTTRPRPIVVQGPVADSDTEDEDLSLRKKTSIVAKAKVQICRTHEHPITKVSFAGQENLAPEGELESSLVSSPEESPKIVVPVPPETKIDSKTLDEPDDTRALRKPFFTGRPLNPAEDVLLGLHGDKTVLPGHTAQWLRPYQIDGIMFMYDLYMNDTGGILGDDMGLGKTVQVIGFLNAIFGKDGSYSDWRRMRYKRAGLEPYPRVLIICPSTLLDNWQKEFDTWSWTHVSRYHGSNRADALNAIAQGRTEVMMTTYTTYKNDADQLNKISWNVVIADECHIIKESKSKVTQHANAVNCKCRIGLTGTAIQNNYNELYTLLNWTKPGAYGSAKEWDAQVSQVLKNGQKHNATNLELDSARSKALELSNNLLPRVLLRRTKALIAHQLPKKSDKVVFCPLTPLQITAYDNLMNSEEMSFLRDSKQPCDCNSGRPRLLCCHQESPNGQTFAQLLFPYLHYLRNLSNHLALCLPRAGAEAESRARDQALFEEALPDHYTQLQSRTPMQNGCDPEMCGKWKVLQRLLRHWKKTHCKVLIFSSSVMLLDMLNDLMMQENYLYEYLHGRMPLEARTAAVDNFNNSEEQFVFLISTRAGGVGLNIVSANKVVIFDPNWNPAHDLQAQDRAYRIGQQRDVEVFRLISVGTVEEVVYARQVYKQQQANIGYEASEERRYFLGVQGDTNQRGELFGVENLLTFHGENHILKAIFSNTDEAELEFDNIRMASIDINATPEDIANLGASDDFGISDVIKSELDTNLLTHDSKALEIKQEDEISRILANAGVSYTHKNNAVVGRSSVEAEISKLASRAAIDVEHRNRKAYDATLLRVKQRAQIDSSISKELKPQSDLETTKASSTMRQITVTSTKNGKRSLPWAPKAEIVKKPINKRI